MLSEDGNVFSVALGSCQSHSVDAPYLNIWVVKPTEVKYIEQCHIAEILVIMAVYHDTNFLQLRL